MDYVYVAAGLCLLLVGGEFLVSGAVKLALRLGISQLVIGLTIVAYGTTAPEMLVSVDAHLAGAPGLAVGNVVGSNIANILLILGCGALIYPICCNKGAIQHSGPTVIAASVFLVLLALGGVVTLWASIPMLTALALFSFHSYYSERRALAANKADPESAIYTEAAEEFSQGPKTLVSSLALLLIGLAGVVAGSHFLVDGALGLARHFGISEATIGLTLVAVGTSLPELATAVVAAYRRHPEVALGNVLGANTFNVLGVMGVLPFFGDLPIPGQIAAFDIWVMFGVTAFFVPWMMFRCRLNRGMAVVFLLAYAAYVACRYYGLAGMPMPAA